MNKNLYYRLELAGLFITFVLGFLLQMCYSLSGAAAWSVIFGSVNDSIWEECKVYALPYLAWSIITFALCRPSFKGFFCAKLVGVYIIVFGSMFTYCLLSGIFGKRFRILEITVSIIFIGLAYIFSVNMGFSNSLQAWFVTALFALMLFIAAYLCFTFSPPKVGIFYDNNTCSYGIPASSYRGDMAMDAMYQSTHNDSLA